MGVARGLSLSDDGQWWWTGAAWMPEPPEVSRHMDVGSVVSGTLFFVGLLLDPSGAGGAVLILAAPVFAVGFAAVYLARNRSRHQRKWVAATGLAMGCLGVAYIAFLLIFLLTIWSYVGRHL